MRIAVYKTFCTQFGALGFGERGRLKGAEGLPVEQGGLEFGLVIRAAGSFVATEFSVVERLGVGGADLEC